MLKIRTFMVPVVFVLILTPVFRIATAGAEVVSNPSNTPASVISSKGGSTNQFEAPGPSDPAKFGGCVDMPGVVASVVACPNPSQIPARSEVPGPSETSTLYECVGIPDEVASIVGCNYPSQIPAP